MADSNSAMFFTLESMHNSIFENSPYWSLLAQRFTNVNKELQTSGSLCFKHASILRAFLKVFSYAKNIDMMPDMCILYSILRVKGQFSNEKRGRR